jgi:hypothetical protein
MDNPVIARGMPCYKLAAINGKARRIQVDCSIAHVYREAFVRFPVEVNLNPREVIDISLDDVQLVDKHRPTDVIKNSAFW